MIYIAYGSNINLEQMARRCPTAEKLTTGVIPNYELEFRGVATIVPKENGNVPVLMWDIKPADEKALDRYEGFPRLYRKEYFSLEYGGETHKAMAYVMNSGQICEPSQTYYNCILEGYKAVGLDTSHLENALARSIEFGEQSQQLDFFDRRFSI